MRSDQFLNRYSPETIYARLQERIIGQDEAKRAIIAAVWWNLYRCTLLAAGQDARLLPAKMNVLLLGPTGIGKTELAKAVASEFCVPWVTTAAPNYSSAGYTGADVDDMLGLLLQAAQGDSESAERGIVVLDEVDKLRRRDFGGQSDVGCEAVQQALLSLLEGCEAMPRGRAGERIKMRSHFVTFVGTGAFVGLNAEPGAVSAAALVSEGFIPEFIARWSLRIRLHDLDRDMLRKIIQSKGSALRKLAHLFAIHGIELIVDDKAIEALIDQALADGVGARALNETLWNRLNGLIGEIPQMLSEGIGKIVIDAGTMRGLPAFKLPSDREDPVPEKARSLLHPIDAPEIVDLSGWSTTELHQRMDFLLKKIAFEKAKPETQSAFQQYLRLLGGTNKPAVVQLCEQLAFAIAPPCSVEEFWSVAQEAECDGGDGILSLVRYRRHVAREQKASRSPRTIRKRPGVCPKCRKPLTSRTPQCPECGADAEPPPL